MKYENDGSNMDRKDLVAASHQVIAMDDEIHSLRAEVARLRGIEKEYYKFLNDTIKHGDVMKLQMLDLIIEKAARTL